jgi:hypothetical protein
MNPPRPGRAPPCGSRAEPCRVNLYKIDQLQHTVSRQNPNRGRNSGGTFVGKIDDELSIRRVIATRHRIAPLSGRNRCVAGAILLGSSAIPGN